MSLARHSSPRRSARVLGQTPVLSQNLFGSSKITILIFQWTPPLKPLPHSPKRSSDRLPKQLSVFQPLTSVTRTCVNRKTGKRIIRAHLTRECAGRQLRTIEG